MPLSTGFTTRAALKGEGRIHSDKWHRCVEKVKAKGGGYEPHAVCTFSIGYNESVNPEHQTPGPHSSRDTRRFKRRKERQQAEKRSYAEVLKFDPKQLRDKFGKWVESLQSVATPAGLFVAGVDTPKSPADVKKQKEAALQQAYEEMYRKQREESRQAGEEYQKRKAAEAKPTESKGGGRSLLSDMLDRGSMDDLLATGAFGISKEAFAKQRAKST